MEKLKFRLTVEKLYNGKMTHEPHEWTDEFKTYKLAKETADKYAITILKDYLQDEKVDDLSFSLTEATDYTINASVIGDGKIKDETIHITIWEVEQ